jgi:hypothetical protein
MVVCAARPFFRRLRDATIGSPRGRIRLDGVFKDEVSHWLKMLPGWSRCTSWAEEARETVVFASDASTSSFAVGVESTTGSVPQDTPAHLVPGAVMYGPWDRQLLRFQHRSDHISFGEAFCTAAAVAAHGPRLAGKTVVFVSDNQNTVSAINRLTCKDSVWPGSCAVWPPWHGSIISSTRPSTDGE